jgi:hypothetical protein
MELRATLFIFVATSMMSGSHAAEPASPPAAAPTIPAEITAMLLEHRGEWRSDGWIIEGDKRTPIKASWECKAALNGVGNICTWRHEWADRPHDAALDIMGYDPNLKVLRMQRVNDTGIMGSGAEVTVHGNTMTVVREFSADGKARVMRNEIVVTKPGEWNQHITFDEDGKRVREWTLTQKRVATATSAPTPLPRPASVVPAEIVAMLEAHRGSWRSEGWIVEGEKRTPVKGTWECKAAVNGVGNVCTWNHEWVDRPHDSALDVMGYDPNLKVLKIQRLNDTGIMSGPAIEVTVRGNTMSREWQVTKDGKPGVGRHEIILTKPGELSGHVTVEVDGKRVYEWTVSHRRVK